MELPRRDCLTFPQRIAAIRAATAFQSTSGVRWHQLMRTQALASSSLIPMAFNT